MPRCALYMDRVVLFFTSRFTVVQSYLELFYSFFSFFSYFSYCAPSIEKKGIIFIY